MLEGTYEFYPYGVWTAMETGRPILSVRGAFHAFRSVGQSSGRIMLATNNGGIDEYFLAISGLTLPDDLERLSEISSHYGYTYEAQPKA